MSDGPEPMLLPRRLPSLDGQRHVGVTAAYVAALAVTLLLFAASTWFDGVDLTVNAPASMQYDFRTSTSVEGVEVAAVGESARSAGLRPGDRILSIDGSPLPPTASEFDIGERLTASGTGELSLRVGREGAQQVDLQLSPRDTGWGSRDPISGLPLWLYASLLLIFQPEIILLIASVLLFRARSSDPEAMMFAFAFLFLTWNGPNLWWLSEYDVDYGWPALVGTFGWILSVIAIGAFPDGRFVPRWSRWLIPVGAFTLAAHILEKLLWVNPPSWAYVPQDLIMLGLVVTAVTAVVLRYRRTDPGIHKQQIKWAAVGFGVSAAIWVIMVPLFLTGRLELEGNAVGFVAVSIIANTLGYGGLPIGLLISLLRYHLYDVEAVVTRSAAYAFLTLIFAATLAVAAKAIEVLAEEYFGRDAGVLPGVVAAGLAVLLITPLSNRVQSWAERRFQKALSHLRRDLPMRIGDLRETSSLPDLLDEVLRQLLAGLRASRAGIIIGTEVAATRSANVEEVACWSNQTVLDANSDSPNCDWKDPMFPVRIPLRVDHAMKDTLGWIVLGPRPDGSFYSKDEREAVSEIADPIARAIQIVLIREARAGELEQRVSAIEQKLNAIADAIDRLIQRPASGGA